MGREDSEWRARPDRDTAVWAPPRGSVLLVRSCAVARGTALALPTGMTTSRASLLLILLAYAFGASGCLLLCGGAPSGSSETSLYLVDDQSGAPVPQPTFSEGGAVLQAECGDDFGAAPDGGACTSWLLIGLSGGGAHHIEVSAPGYQTTWLDVDTSVNADQHTRVVMHPGAALPTDRVYPQPAAG
jgi:hypothetical protein